LRKGCRFQFNLHGFGVFTKHLSREWNLPPDDRRKITGVVHDHSMDLVTPKPFSTGFIGNGNHVGNTDLA
jgi:hypothetical protein